MADHADGESTLPGQGTPLPFELDRSGTHASGWLRGLRRHLERVHDEMHQLSPDARRALLAAIESVQTAFPRHAEGGSLFGAGTPEPDSQTLEWPRRLILVGDGAHHLETLFVALAQTADWPGITLAHDIDSARLRISSERFDLVLLSQAPGTDDGLSVLDVLRKLPDCPPVILVAAEGDERLVAEAFRTGAADYLFGLDLSIDRMRRAVSRAVQRHRLEQELEAAHARLAELVNRDPLTGLHNRRYLQTRLAIEFARARRFEEPLALILVDVDHFKLINDRHGHAGGDRVLADLARLLTERLRQIDLVARLGGDEFALILPNTSIEGASNLAARLVQRVRGVQFFVGKTAIAVTLSAGVASYPLCDAADRDQLFECADQALYRAKGNGRDRIECSPKPSDDRPPG